MLGIHKSHIATEQPMVKCASLVRVDIVKVKSFLFFFWVSEFIDFRRQTSHKWARICRSKLHSLSERPRIRHSPGRRADIQHRWASAPLPRESVECERVLPSHWRKAPRMSMMLWCFALFSREKRFYIFFLANFVLFDDRMAFRLRDGRT